MNLMIFGKKDDDNDDDDIDNDIDTQKQWLHNLMKKYDWQKSIMNNDDIYCQIVLII